MIEITKEILGFPITVTATPAGSDWNIIVLGGYSPHVGSVSLAEFKDNAVTLRTLVCETHKDHVVGDQFARTIAHKLHCTVCVSCGIHFDNPTAEDLQQIVSTSKTMLDELCNKIG